MCFSTSFLTTLTGSFLALLATVIWAGNFIAAKILVTELSPDEVNFIRWFFSSLLMIPISYPYFKKNWQAVKRNFLLLFAYGFFGIFIGNLVFHYAPKTASAVDMTILMSISPILVMLFSWFFFKEYISRKNTIGSLVAFFGVVTLVTNGHYFDIISIGFTPGHFLVLIAAICFALYSSCLRLFKEDIHITVFLQIIFSIGAFCSAIMLFFQAPPISSSISLQAISSILYLSIASSLIAFFAWNEAIRRIGAVKTGIIYYTIPVFGVLLAVIILGESVSSVQLLGGALVFFGVIICTTIKEKHSENSL